MHRWLSLCALLLLLDCSSQSIAQSGIVHHGVYNVPLTAIVGHGSITAGAAPTPDPANIHSINIATGLKWDCDGLWHVQTVPIPHGLKIYGAWSTAGTVSSWMDWEVWSPQDLILHIPKVEGTPSWDLLQTPPGFRWFYPAYFTSYNDTINIGGWCNNDAAFRTATPPYTSEWMMGGALLYVGN